jgi:6-phosphogluconolactonase/glucosamine-6-phosphate isomerase/deaminase
VLARARTLVVVVTGAAKAAVVARVLRSPPSPDVPLSIVCARASDVSWIIDRAAAARLA